jgi:uncharacterized protein
MLKLCEFSCGMHRLAGVFSCFSHRASIKISELMSQRVKISHLLFPTIAGLSLASAGAQSFDCAKATEPAEKFICANKELSAADKKMAAAFKAAMSQLSDEGKRRLIESQRSWIRYDRNVAKLDVDEVKASYTGRIDELEKSISTAGPFRIQAVSIYKADISGKPKPVSASDDSDTSGGSVSYIFPRIESPATPDTERWNRMAEQRVKTMAGEIEPGVDMNVEYSITYASEDVISLSLGAMTYAKGAAHPNHAGAGYIVLLKSGRELRPADLFDPQSKWNSFLARSVYHSLKTQAQEEGWILDVTAPADLAKEVATVSRWTIGAKGLIVSFMPYEVSAYAAGPHDVTISWTDLQPYLNTTLPFPVPLQ